MEAYQVKTKKDYYKFVKTQHAAFKEAQADMAANGMEIDDCSMAYDVVDGIFAMNPELKVFMVKVMGIGDPVGRLADDVACG